MDGHTVVPKSRGPSAPLEADLDVQVLLIDTKQVVQQYTRLCSFEADDAESVLAVDEERLPASHRVYADEWVLALDRDALAGVVGIGVRVSRPVDCCESVDNLAERRREFVVGRVARGPVGVAADLGDGVVVEVSDARGLALVRQVCERIMSASCPFHQTQSEGLTSVPVLSGERVPEPVVVGPGEFVPDDRDSRQARNLRRRGVNLNSAKVGSEVTLGLRSESVLVAEEDHSALGD